MQTPRDVDYILVNAGLSMNTATNSHLVPMTLEIALFLVVYGVVIVRLFTRKVNGRRRRWAPLDFVWVPMGGLTGALMFALWWQSH